MNFLFKTENLHNFRFERRAASVAIPPTRFGSIHQFINQPDSFGRISHCTPNFYVAIRDYAQGNDESDHQECRKKRTGVGCSVQIVVTAGKAVTVKHVFAPA